MSHEQVSDDELVRLVRGELGVGRALWLRAEIVADPALGERYSALEFVSGHAAGPLLAELLEQAPTPAMKRRLDLETARAPGLRPPMNRTSDRRDRFDPNAPGAVQLRNLPPAPLAPSERGSIHAGISTRASGASGGGLGAVPTRGPAGASNRVGVADRRRGAGFERAAPGPQEHWRIPPSLLAAALLVAVLTLGLFAMSGSSRSSISSGASAASLDWRDSVAAYQRLYTTLTLSEVQTEPGAVARAGARLSEISGLPVRVPDLAQSRMTFKRGQLLRFEDKPLVQLAYLSDSGVPVAICLIRAAVADHALVFERRHGLNTALWTRDGISTLAIADLPDDRLRAIARASGAGG